MPQTPITPAMLKGKSNNDDFTTSSLFDGSGNLQTTVKRERIPIDDYLGKFVAKRPRQARVQAEASEPLRRSPMPRPQERQNTQPQMIEVPQFSTLPFQTPQTQLVPVDSLAARRGFA